MTTFTTRIEMLASLPRNSIIAEIGVFAGDFAEEILRACSPRGLYLVDMWEGSHSSGDKDGHNVKHIESMLSTYLSLSRRYQRHGSVRLVRTPSASFFDAWDADFFDAVYIDGDHSYAGVRADLEGAMKVTRHDGFIMGHDYHGDVARAVGDFCRANGQTVTGVASDRCPSFMIRLSKP